MIIVLSGFEASKHRWRDAGKLFTLALQIR